jgi:hypothetical protein
MPTVSQRAESVKAVGGLLALTAGLVVLGLVAGIAIIATPGDAGSTATGAFGVIGSIVGAYFGVKVGADGAQKAVEGQRAEAARAQIFAAHIPREEADDILHQADDAAHAARGRQPRMEPPKS